MVNVGVNAPDIGFQATSSGKTAGAGVKSSQQDQFKKLLQGKQDSSQDNGTREVSRDAKQEKTEASQKSEESKGKDKDVKENQMEETVSTDDSQARGLFAAYQMDQGFRPELLAAEPEVVIEMPEVVEAVPEAAVELTGELISGNLTEQVNAQPETVETAAATFQTEVKPQETVQAKEPEVQTAAPETVEAAPVRKETVKTQSSGEENQTQSNDHQEEHTAAAAAPVAQAPVRDMGEDVKPQEVTTVYVAQPEELPEKLTDQIMGKMSEGVQSFEIEIEPENLGKIAVKIQYEDGQATVSIFCTEKKALDVLGNHAREIGGILERNLGGETKIIVEKQEPDYLNQNRDENQQGKQDGQEQQKEGNRKQQDTEDSEQFLQKLRLGLTG